MKIFISYDKSDQDFVNLLAPLMRENGYEPQAIDLYTQLGDKLHAGVSRALRECDHAIVVLSEAYTQSDWFEEELVALFIIEQAKPNFILPVIIENCKIPAIIRRKKLADFRDVNFKDQPDQMQGTFQRLTELVRPRKVQVFIVMTLTNPRLNDAYRNLIKPMIENEFGFKATRIDENVGDGRVAITDQILVNLDKSDVVLVDLTDERPNCYYEAGYAHALEKEIIFTVQEESTVHFDLAGYPQIRWSDENHLAKELRRHLTVIRDKLVKKPSISNQNVGN
jgi:hypothetical protein